MGKAIFIDRDGVLNPLVLNPDSGEYEAPRALVDFALYPYAEKSLAVLRGAGYGIVLVSNQPDFAKGKASMESLLRVAEALRGWSDERGGLIDKYCYCFHHPEGVLPEYARACDCRKPGTLFLEQAKEQLSLDPQRCWFIGDRDSDIECGRRFGCGTVKIDNPHSKKYSGAVRADHHVEDLLQALAVILR